MKSRSETLDRFVKAFLFNAIMEYDKNLDLADIKYFCEIDNFFKTEEWKGIPNYEECYEVSDLGSFTNEYDAHLAYEKALKEIIK